MTGLESLKVIYFLKFNLKSNSTILWIIQLQTHQKHLQILVFPAPHGGVFVIFFPATKINPYHYPRVEGGFGVYFDWCISVSVSLHSQKIPSNKYRFWNTGKYRFKRGVYKVMHWTQDLLFTAVSRVFFYFSLFKVAWYYLFINFSIFYWGWN